MIRVTRLGILIVVLGACGFKPSTAGAPGDDAPRADDAPIPTDADMPVNTGPCGTPGAIRDDFADNVTGAQWRTSGMVSEQGGELVATPDSNTTFGGYISKHRVDLTGSSVTVEVTAMVDTTKDDIAALYAITDATHYLVIYQSHGKLYAGWDDGAPGPTLASSNYDPTADRWWQLSEAGGTMTIAASPDGVTWAALATTPTKTWVTSVGVALGGYSDMPHGSVHYDNLDTGLAPAGWCKAGTFSDAFARTGVGDAWTARKTPTMGGGCTATVATGAHFDQDGTANSRCWLASAHGYDLRASSIGIELAAITNTQPGWTTFLRAISDTVTDAFLIQFDTDMLCAQIRSQAETCVPYSTSFTHWRVTEAGGTLTFDASPDAQTWTTVLAAPDPFPLDTLEIQIGTEATTGFAPGPLGLTVGSYN